jgi:hypothetical protein
VSTFRENTSAEDEAEKAAQALLDWAIRAWPGDLAAELMAAFAGNTRAFTPGDLARWLFREYPKSTKYKYVAQLSIRNSPHPIKEAIQLLEHAELVYLASTNEAAVPEESNWRPTRLGLATLASGKDAVRQRIKDRTGL